MAYDWLNYARLYLITSNYSKNNFLLLLYDSIAIVQLNIWYLRYFKFVYFRKPVLRPNPRYWWTVLDYMLQNRSSFITRKCKYDRRLKYRNLQCMRQSFYQLSKLLHYYFGGNDQNAYLFQCITEPVVGNWLYLHETELHFMAWNDFFSIEIQLVRPSCNIFLSKHNDGLFSLQSLSLY